MGANETSRGSNESANQEVLTSQQELAGQDLPTSIAAFFRDHPAIVGTLIYLQVTSIGVIYSWTLYAQFDINIFDFAESNDFLLAAFKEPFAFFMSMLALLYAATYVVLIMIWSRIRRQRLGPSYSLSTNLAVVLLVIAIVVTPFPGYFYGKNTAASLPDDKDRKVTIQYRAGSGATTVTTKSKVTLIGTTENYSLFYDTETNHSFVIPHAQLVSIEFLHKAQP